MPELPEVEHFRQILLPLVTARDDEKKKQPTSVVLLECPPPLPTKRFPSLHVIDAINRGGYVMKDVLRKGKVLCVILEKQCVDTSTSTTKTKKKKAAKKETINENDETTGDETTTITGDEPLLYLSLHMGMTGRISSPTHVPALESLSDDDPYPPPHTHLIFHSNGTEAAFSDPRRFGSVLVDVAADVVIGSSGIEDDKAAAVVKHEDVIPTFTDIAMDALEASTAYCAATKSSKIATTDHTDTNQQTADHPTLVDKLSNRKKGVKGLLLDQRAVISGVGNWVADEVLYRSNLHPDQSYLTHEESKTLVHELQYVLSTAIDSMNSGLGFPEEWLFHRRWRGGGGSGGGNVKDYHGKNITFVVSGGRSTAIVPSLQKLHGRAKANAGNSKKGKATASKKTKAKSNDRGKTSTKPKKETTTASKKAKAKRKPSTQESSSAKSKKKETTTTTKTTTTAAKTNSSSTKSKKKTQGEKRKRTKEEPSASSKPTTSLPTRRSKRIAAR